VGPLDNVVPQVLVSGLATQFCVEPKVPRKFLPEAIEKWGKLRGLEGEDITYAHDIVPKRMGDRDASRPRA
jgi:hypothetical protein